MSQQDFFIQKVQEAPENKLFRFSLSKILFDQEQFIEAIPHLEKCIQLQDDWMLAHILLGKSLIQSQQADKAEAVLEKALELAEEQNHDDPKNVQPQRKKSPEELVDSVNRKYRVVYGQGDLVNL